jgi:hypothetical protein
MFISKLEGPVAMCEKVKSVIKNLSQSAESVG